MNKYNVKSNKMKEHLNNHPKDYQTVISILKTDSSSITYEINQQRNKMLKKIAKFKRGDKIGK